ncbi:catalase family peroxidase [Pseudomonas sp. NPDC089554]|uniref:catalase family peroxidase n=1 Tax=Pseudomonas sp. NPDC089554 TaxID=3390653 RepID=UPI003CFE7533
MVDAFEGAAGRQYAGFRRNHAKGICITGRFYSNGNGTVLSRAAFLRAGRFDVLGRFSVSGGNPSVNDNQVSMRSLALALDKGDEHWRMAMNSIPVFPVRTPEALLAQLKASLPGQGDRAERLHQFRLEHPEVQAFEDWSVAHPPSSGFDNAQYFSVSSFRFMDEDGHQRYVRWRLQPQAAYAPVSAEQRAQNDPDGLFHALVSQLAAGPMRWNLILTVALPGDAVNDATQQWIQPGHQEIDAGVLVIDKQQSQIDGPCRDVDFNPLMLPTGITPSDDPLLKARSAAYGESYVRRLWEQSAQ